MTPAAVPQRIELRASEPRALAVSSDGSAVFVAAFDSGNQTTAVPYLSVEAGGGAPPPDPPMRPGRPITPRVALIVKHDGTHWREEIGWNWDSFVPYRVLDHDVWTLDHHARSGTGVGGVGTTLLILRFTPRVVGSTSRTSKHETTCVCLICAGASRRTGSP